ncbi:AzlD domain-containing protein [Geodermatophilus sp. SYSU D00815]
MWTAVLVVGGLSLAFRLLPVLAVARTGLGERSAQLLRHAAAGAVAALVVPAVVGGGTGGADPAVLVAVAVGGVLAWRGRSMVRVVLAGGCAYGLVAAAAALV